MRNPRRISTLLTLLVIAVVALTASCSDKSTNPTGGVTAKELDSGTIPPGGVFVEMQTGQRHGCGLTAAGEIRCWGSGPAAAGP